MNAEVARDVRALQRKCVEVFGEETRTGNRQYLIKRLSKGRRP